MLIDVFMKKVLFIANLFNTIINFLQIKKYKYLIKMK